MCSTVAPSWSEGMSRRLQDKGLLYLDAPISGGSAKAESGDITMMTSGPAKAYEVADQALQAMSSNVHRVGAEPGLGSKVKLVNQLLAGVHIAAAAEAMAFGIREGLDPRAIYEVITHSAGNSWMTASPPEAAFGVGLHKDSNRCKAAAALSKEIAIFVEGSQSRYVTRQSNNAPGVGRPTSPFDDSA